MGSDLCIADAMRRDFPHVAHLDGNARTLPVGAVEIRDAGVTGYQRTAIV